MAWRVIGYIEGRNGHVSFLPTVGDPNSFERAEHATACAHGMQTALGGDKSPIRYLAIPSLDKRMHDLITGGAVAHAPPPPPPAPTVSFTAPGPTPAPAQAFAGNGATQ